MRYQKKQLSKLLEHIDFGSSIAEKDELLETARVETSVFTDLLNDKVDLIPGTKGSGKSALYRIFVDFLSEHLLISRKVVIAHGVKRYGDNIFHAFNDTFEKMSEEEFINFWCVYLVSLANEHFIKEPRYIDYIKDHSKETQAFRRACQNARIPDFDKPKSLYDVLGWVLAVLKSWGPKIKYRPQNGIGEYEIDLFGNSVTKEATHKVENKKVVLPLYVQNIKDSLENLLKEAGLSLWLMIDRLDEIFPRRSNLETRALRGLLKSLRIFESKEIRVKVFLRDDILNQVVSDGKGFTALTHLTAQKADTLRWDEKQILTMIVRRLYANDDVRNYLQVDTVRLKVNSQYQEEMFYKVFPPAVELGSRQSSTLRWIYNHTMDGNGVVTPRDVIDLLTKAKQKQQDEFKLDSSGECEYIIGPVAIKYGHSELSKRKRYTFLEAEFPHLFKYIKKFIGGKTEYSEASVYRILGKRWPSIMDDLISIGLVRRGRQNGSITFKFPFLYREGLELTQGRA